MKPILEAEFHHDGRGPELQRVIWSSSVPQGFEYFNPEDTYVAENLRHVRLVRVEAFAFAGEEVHGNIVTNAATNAAIHDLGQSPWLQSFNPCHLDDCSHYQIMFYDEIFDVICHEIHADVGPFKEQAPPNKPMLPDAASPRRGSERRSMHEDALARDLLTSLVREMPGKGRCDLSVLLRDASAFKATSEELARPFLDDRIDIVVGLEAAGLPFAGAVALHLGAGLVLLRRHGKSAWSTRGATCRDYSGAEKTFEVVTDAVRSGQRCLVVDDWSETGAQLALAKRLLTSLGADVVGFSCVNIDKEARRHCVLSGCRLESAVVDGGPVAPGDGM